MSHVTTAAAETPLIVTFPFCDCRLATQYVLIREIPILLEDMLSIKREVKYLVLEICNINTNGSKKNMHKR